MNEQLNKITELLDNYDKSKKLEMQIMLENMNKNENVVSKMPEEIKRKIVDLNIYDLSEQYYIDTYLIDDKNDMTKTYEKMNELEIINALTCDDDRIRKLELIYEKINKSNLEYELKLFYEDLFYLEVREIKDDDNKIKMIEKYKKELLEQEDNLLDVIESLEDDDRKIAKINEFEKYLSSIDDIQKKNALLEYMLFPVISIKDDDKKIKLIDEYKNKLKLTHIGKIIASLNDDNKKIDIAKELKICNKPGIFFETIAISIKDKKKRLYYNFLHSLWFLGVGAIVLEIILVIAFILMEYFF